MDPVTWIAAGTALLQAFNGPSGGGSPGAMGGMAASGGAPIFNTSEQDFSGFTVATGGSKAVGATIDKVKSNQAGMEPGQMGYAPSTGIGPIQIPGIGNVSPLLLVGVAIAGVLVWRMVKK